jgi:hypothetical protein
MRHKPSQSWRAGLSCFALLTLLPLGIHGSDGPLHADQWTNDPVVARVYEHFGEGPKPIVQVIGPDQFAMPIWKRVRNLVAFRIHRHGVDGTTVADAAIYLVRGSAIYQKAAAALRNNATQKEYVWCLLAAVFAHESAHTTPATERQALVAEAAQLRRCLSAGHLFAGDGWSALSYLGKVEAKLLNPREHY